MKALDRKLVRELERNVAQVVSIAVLLAAGIAAVVSLGGNQRALELARDRFYDERRFGDVFVRLARAPRRVVDEIRELPGVREVEARIAIPATVFVPGDSLPVLGRVRSISTIAGGGLDAVELRRGRLPERDDEALCYEAFAERRGLGLGDTLDVVIEGRRRSLVVTGHATSPGEIFPMPVGEAAPDPERFAVLWMREEPLASASGLRGSTNELVLRLDGAAPGSHEEIRRRLRGMLERFGVEEPSSRDRHPSHLVLEGELAQLRVISRFVPALFFAVATLLVQIVTTRLVELERPAIATLKALGYGTARVALHFLEFALVEGLLGAILGVAVGAWLGFELTALYARFFRIPGLRFALPGPEVAVASAGAVVSACLGALGAVLRVARLAPAVAMHPPAPTRQPRTWLDHPRLRKLLVPSVRMVLRDARRRPLRTVLGVAAIASAVGLLVVGRWFGDATESMVDLQFFRAMTEDVTVTFDRPVAATSVGALHHLPGVLAVEGLRGAPARIRHGSRERDTVVWSPVASGLRKLVDRNGRAFALAPSGLVLSDALGDALDVKPGDEVSLEWRDGDRTTVRAMVAGFGEDMVGLQAYAEPRWLSGLRGELPSSNLALLAVDPLQEPRLHEALRRLPRVAVATRRAELVARFRRQTGEMMNTFTLIVSVFAVTMALGVLQNQARVALSSRARELATMRVLGYTAGEAAAVLVGELGAHVLVSLPLGLVLGQRMAKALASTVDPERFRMPLVLAPRSAAFAVTLTLLAAAVTSSLVAWRLRRTALTHALDPGAA